MGSVRHPELGDLAKEIWQWCEIRDLWLHAAYIPSKRQCRRRPRITNTPQKQNGVSMNKLSNKTFNGLVASRLNHKCPQYVSWHQDPGAITCDAFAVPWNYNYFYAFPPFALILRTKLRA
ncbi:hypothetical protein Zmor_006341 [Zophobas morio]|uniref:Uncharacterized protein n=1 Tax=Zophobas morio TaxID=2755281 RepID=A0AA38MLC6_9CUCU|nr:hypothetical protein Zmor_006341 [Zophobas morio]